MRRKKNVHRRLRLTLLINQGKKTEATLKNTANTQRKGTQREKRAEKKVNTTSSKDYTHKKDVGYTRKIIKSFSPFFANVLY